MNKSGIYWIRNKINNHIYIGSSINMIGRKHKHSRLLNRKAHENSHLQNVYNKYGLKNFRFKILIICDPNMLLFYEQQFLDYFHPQYNICPTAGNNGGHKCSEETKRKISLAHIGYKFSKDAKKNMSIAQMGHKRKGWKLSKETKKKISIARKGHMVSEETKKKISKSNVGQKRSENTKHKISECLIGNKNSKGRKWSDEDKRKISERMKGNRNWDNGYNDWK